MLRIVVLLSTIAFVSAIYVRSHNCTIPDIKGTNFYIKVSGCNSSFVNCPLYKGSSHSIKFCFTPTVNTSNNCIQKIFGIISTFQIPYGGPLSVCSISKDDQNRDASKGYVAGHQYCYEQDFNVLPWYPTMALKVQFQVEDKDNNNCVVACLQVPVEIKNP